MANPPVKRRRYAAGDGTPRERKIMLGLVVACVAGVLLFPRSKAPEPVEVILAELEPETPDLSADNEAAEAVDEMVSDESSPEETTDDPNIAAASVVLPPLADVINEKPRTAEEYEKQIALLEKYFLNGSVEDRDLAAKFLVDMGPELTNRLPRLMKKVDGQALVYFVKAALELKATGVVPAIIDRLESKNSSGIHKSEVIAALIAFNTPRANEYVNAELNSKDEMQRMVVWQALDENMSPTWVARALKTAVEGGKDFKHAASALGRFCSSENPNKDAVNEVARRVEGALSQANGPVKSALIFALLQMDPEVVAPLLTGMMSDDDLELRGRIAYALARSPVTASGTLVMLRNDENDSVKSACLQAFAYHPYEEAVQDMINLLSHESLKMFAHKALVRASNGLDFGYETYRWQEWYNKGGHKEEAKITVEEPLTEEQVKELEESKAQADPNGTLLTTPVP